MNLITLGSLNATVESEFWLYHEIPISHIHLKSLQKMFEISHKMIICLAPETCMLIWHGRLRRDSDRIQQLLRGESFCLHTIQYKGSKSLLPPKCKNSVPRWKSIARPTLCIYLPSYLYCLNSSVYLVFVCYFTARPSVRPPKMTNISDNPPVSARPSHHRLFIERV